jgi:ribulose-phosphate 3-epimerase
LPLLYILVSARALESIVGPASTIVEMIGHRGLPLLNSFIAVALWLGLAFWLAPDSGATGMAWAIAIATVASPHVRGVMDVHLMIAPADPYLEAFVKAGADIVTVHVEAGPHLDRSLQLIRTLGAKAGVALNPATPETAIEYVLDRIDLICVMTVNPGFGGQSFLTSQIEKVRRLRAMVSDRPIHIEIDGGVTPETAPLVAAAGADVLVAGSAVFKGGSVATPEVYGRNIAAIRAAAEGARAAA